MVEEVALGIKEPHIENALFELLHLLLAQLSLARIAIKDVDLLVVVAGFFMQVLALNDVSLIVELREVLFVASSEAED